MMAYFMDNSTSTNNNTTNPNPSLPSNNTSNIAPIGSLKRVQSRHFDTFTSNSGYTYENAPNSGTTNNWNSTSPNNQQIAGGANGPVNWYNSGTASTASTISTMSNMSNVSNVSGSTSSSKDEELIPTAIVIKNIPFAIKKEQLLDVMTSLNLPLPYAFNYHFDNGVFRGLAFANFTNAEETAVAIANLNGKEIGGRKLRVEYKKMLPLAERERIEREKRERRGQLEEQHRSAKTGTISNNNRKGIDLNDPETLEYYSQLLLFKDDRARLECVFSNLIHHQKRIIGLLCNQLNLSKLEKGNNTVIITKNQHVSTSSASSISSVSSTGLFHPQPHHYNASAMFTTNPPPAFQNQLRGTKSFADFRGPLNNNPYNLSTPGTPVVNSPFFTSHTPPPMIHQHRTNSATYLPQMLPTSSSTAFPPLPTTNQDIQNLSDSFSSVMSLSRTPLNRVPSINQLRPPQGGIIGSNINENHEQ